MKNGKLRIVIGVLLLVIQLIGICGLEETNIDLLDTNKNISETFTPESTELSFAMWFQGFHAGVQKFNDVFAELPEALAEEGFYYHANTSDEFLSVKIRENLSASGHFFQRILYDLNSLTGFYLFGILGVILIVSGILAWRRKADLQACLCHMDILNDHPADWLQIPGIVICTLVFLLSAGCVKAPADLLPLLAYGLMSFFFGFYYGKKPSVLPAAAFLLLAVYYLPQSIDMFTYAIDAHDSTVILLYQVWSLMDGIHGWLYLIGGLLLYYRSDKKISKWLILIAGAVELLLGSLGLNWQNKLNALLTINLFLTLSQFAFTALMMLYMCLVRSVVPVIPVRKPQREPVPEGACPMCRAPLNPGKDHCSRCGAAVPVVAEAAEAPEPKAPRSPKFCHRCGKPLQEGYRFCGQCGEPVWQPTPRSEITEQ